MPKEKRKSKVNRDQKLDRLLLIANLRQTTDYSYDNIGKVVGLSGERVRVIWKEFGPYFERAAEPGISAQERDKRLNERDEYIEKHLIPVRVPKEQTAVTPELEKRLKQEIEKEKQRNAEFGPRHKQHMNASLLHRTLEKEGFQDLPCYATVKLCYERLWQEEKRKEAFFDQLYYPGERMELDLGYIKIYLGGKLKLVPIIVITLPYSKYRWVDVLEDEKAETIMAKLDQALQEIGGVPGEIAVDNAPQIIQNHYAKTEAEKLSPLALQISHHYVLHFVACQIAKGNEKGSVESSVKVIRRENFVNKFHFENLEEVRENLRQFMEETNDKKALAEDVAAMKPIRKERFDPFTYQDERKVSTYLYVQYKNCYYSAPHELLGKQVDVYTSTSRIRFYYNNELKAEHELITREEEERGEIYRLDYRHFISLMNEKPGGLKRSRLLRTNPDLNNLFLTNFKGNTKAFKCFLTEMNPKPASQLRWCVESFLEEHPTILDEEEEFFSSEKERKPESKAQSRKNSRKETARKKDISLEASEIEESTSQALSQLDRLVMGGTQYGY